MVKENLMSDKKIQKLGIKNWSVSPAYPPTDIVWTEIQNISRTDGVYKAVSIFLINVICATALYCGVYYLDNSYFYDRPSIKLIMHYICPLLWIVYSLYVNPYLLFQLI